MPMRNTCKTMTGAAVLVAIVAACGGGSEGKAPDVVLQPNSSNPVAYWHDVGVATINATGDLAATPEELRPTFQSDLATMHVAVYDAVVAIDGRFEPFAAKPLAPASGASADAAVGAAAYGVLRALFPNRRARYQASYDSFLAGIADGDAKARGLAVGAEAAARIVAQRANDGRAVVLPAYVPGTAPGKFRGNNPVSRHFQYIKPFIMSSTSQFRPAPPPALDSATYAADLNELKALGGATSSARTVEQFEIARFHTESPPVYLTRNFGRLARTTANTTDAARLMAIIYVGYSDAINACFEAKYFYDAWRPLSAIPLADTDNNPATMADAAWTPSVPTPPHPEYPAAHSCTAGVLGELFRLYYGTNEVKYSFRSDITGTTHTYTKADGLTEESKMARIYGGMHFRYSTFAGADLGKQVANYTLQHKFRPRQ